MKKIILIYILLGIGICKISAQSVDLFKSFRSKKEKAELFSQQLQHTKDSLLRIIDSKLYKARSLEDIDLDNLEQDGFEYKFPTIHPNESMESLKRKSRELDKIKKEIEQALIKKEIEQAKADSIQKVNDAARIAQERIADSLYLIRAAQTWEWLYDKKGKWETIDRSYPKEEHYKVNSLFPQYQVIDMNAYLNGELVGVCDPNKNNKDKGEQDYQFRERMMKFLCQQDYLSNKYNIKKEPAKTQEYIKLKLGLIDEIQPQQSPILKNMITNAAKLQAAKEKLQKGEISIETYNKLKSKLEANTSKSVFKAMSENESSEIEAGKRYLEQLKDDNSPHIKSYIIKRIDGTNFTYLFSNEKGEETLSVKVSFFVNDKKEVHYKISSLQIK